MRCNHSHRLGIHLVLPLDLFFFFIYFCFLTIVFFQSLIARNREKSLFLREHKEDWDCLINEARLHRDMTAQLQ